MQLSERELRRIFTKLKVETKPSTHHVAGWFLVDGKRVLPLHYSRGHNDMPGHVPEKFRKQMFLNRVEFLEMKRCTMTRDEYVVVLQERGVL